MQDVLTFLSNPTDSHNHQSESLAHSAALVTSENVTFTAFEFLHRLTLHLHCMVLQLSRQQIAASVLIRFKAEVLAGA